MRIPILNNLFRRQAFHKLRASLVVLLKADITIIREEEARTFGRSVKNWPAFDDAPATLNYLRQHYLMATLTNCDRISYMGSNARLEIEWDAIYTAQDAGSYKPSPRNFDFMLERVRKVNDGPLPNACLEAIWRELMSGSFALEAPLKIGYLGPAGSFSHLAAMKQFGECVDYEPFESISNVFHGVESRRTSLALVPIENSTGGGIHETLDCFLQTTARVCRR